MDNEKTDSITDLTCIDKISANIAIQIKFDPKTLNWYIKDVRMSHAEFLDSAKLKSWVYIETTSPNSNSGGGKRNE